MSLEHLQKVKSDCREEQEPALLSLSSSVGTSLPLSEEACSWNPDLKFGMSFPHRNNVLHGD